MAATIKCSTVLVSEGNRLTSYRSVDEVPLEIRRRFLQRPGGLRTGTILIADRKGREEWLRGTQTGDFEPAEAASRGLAWQSVRPWVEGAILCALGAGIWALLALR